MAEREFIDEVIIAENGSLKTFASYYKGHLPLDHYVNMGGQHVQGFTGPETRFVSKRLFATRILGEVTVELTHEEDVSLELT